MGCPMGCPFRLPPSLAPESCQRQPVRGFTEFLESTFADLADPLARDAHERADLLQRHGFRSLFHAVIEIENLAFAGGEILAEGSVNELSHQREVGVLFDLATVHANESFTECGGLAIGSVNRRVERDFGRRHLPGGADRSRCLLDEAADLVIRGVALQYLRQYRLGARELDELR